MSSFKHCLLFCLIATTVFSIGPIESHSTETTILRKAPAKFSSPNTRQVALVSPRNGLITVDPSFHLVQGSIGLSPTAVDTGSTPRVTITSSGLLVK
jgi:hypothetical protein